MNRKNNIIFVVRLVALCAVIALVTRGLLGAKKVEEPKTPVKIEVRNDR